MNEELEGNTLVAEIKEAAKHPAISVRDAIGKAPQVANELIRLLLTQHRPLLAELYNSSRSAREMYERSIDRWNPLDMRTVENLGTVLQWVLRHGLGGVNYGLFGMVQQSSANVYSAILMFECDKFIRAFKTQLDLPDLEAGPMFLGQPFTRILRAAGNQYRHGLLWMSNPDAKKIDDVQTLSAIGVRDVSSADVPSQVLGIIGGASYFEFEDSLFESLFSITEHAGGSSHLGRSNGFSAATPGNRSPS